MTVYAFGPGGWIRLFDADPSHVVLVRIAEASVGRLRIVEVRVADPAGVGITDLKKLPLRKTEAVAAQTFESLDDLAALWHPVPIEEVPAAIDALVAATVGVAEPHDMVRKRRPALKLTGISTRGKRPDAFYQRVARAYLWLAGTSSRPAADLAAANSVPVSTVHRWVREARSRGFLPPGDKGRAV